MNAVLYARVSTSDQAELSIPAQLQAMRDYARQREWTVAEEFVEPGVSARTTERPMLKQLLARCREGPKVDVVLVHKVDRLARDVYGHATIKALLKQRSIRLASVVENVDDSITGQLVENIMASIAEFYSANLGEEVKKGMRVMVQRGEWPHLPPRGYTQTRTAEGRPLAVPDETVAPAIAEAFQAYAKGRFSLRDIGEELFIRGITTSAGKRLPLSYVRDMLENPFYAGRFRWNGAEYAAKHAPIVSEGLFQRVQRILRRRFKNPGERGRTRYLLRGVARCGECGYRMTAERRKRWSYYRCIQHAHGKCSSLYSKADEAHTSLVTLYKQFRLRDEFKEAILVAAVDECERRQLKAKRDAEVLRRRREKLLAREIKLTESYTAGQTSIDAYRALGRKIRAGIEEVDTALRSQPSSSQILKQIRRLLDAAGSLADLHSSFDLAKQQRLLAVVFEQLTLDRGAIISYVLRPPFDTLFDGSKEPRDPDGGTATPLSEQRSATPAKVRCSDNTNMTTKHPIFRVFYICAATGSRRCAAGSATGGVVQNTFCC